MVSSKKRLLGSGPAKLQRIGLETGIVSRGWSPEPYPDQEIVLQLGLGNNNKIPLKNIIKQIGMEDPSIVSIGKTSKADFECKISENTFSKIRGEDGWYDVDAISEKIPESWSCLIVNLEEGVGDNY